MSKELTQENYYQDKAFLTVSRLKQYRNCEAKALAMDRGEWVEDRDEKPLLFGNYVHSAFESPEAHEAFKTENKGRLFSSRKPYGLLKDFELAEVLIANLKADTEFGRLYHGERGDEVVKELIVTGEIAGVPFKGKLDSVNLTKGYFVDLKTCRKLRDPEWSSELRKKVPAFVNNILGFGYHIQLAIYQELLKQMTGRLFLPLIVAVSKELHPDKDIIVLDGQTLAEGLSEGIESVPRVSEVMAGRIEPDKCGYCDYCRSQKKLGNIWSLSDLINLYE